MNLFALMDDAQLGEAIARLEYVVAAQRLRSNAIAAKIAEDYAAALREAQRELERRRC